MIPVTYVLHSRLPMARRKDSKLINLQVSSDLKERLQITCKKLDVTEASFIRDAIQTAIDAAQESLEWLAYKCQVDKREPKAIVEGRTYQEAHAAARELLGPRVRIELVPRRDAYKPHLAALEEATRHD